METEEEKRDETEKKTSSADAAAVHTDSLYFSRNDSLKTEGMEEVCLSECVREVQSVIW
jgi:hypothetical protein